ncbi:uncharacterized protein METZ01_LOCUS221611 [marine metagenome]|uniref:Uncharacterized protein n=1 Tax=marine metagenome TaxID=408172 RepID=A0A382G2K8_9ZZZZ
MQQIHNLNAVSREPGDMATAWRHLARWPGLLELIHTGMAPLAPNATSIRQGNSVVLLG